jgi:hypothetical protein
MSIIKEEDAIDFKQLTVTENRTVIIVLNHRSFDDDGLEISSSFEKLRFEKGDDISTQIPMIQKICSDAWATK